MTVTSIAPKEIAPTYTVEIEGRKIAVYDDLLPNDELLKLWSILNRAGFTRTEIARPDTAEHRPWATAIPVEALPSCLFWGRRWLRCKTTPRRWHVAPIAATSTSRTMATCYSRTPTACQVRARSPRCGTSATAGTTIGAAKPCSTTLTTTWAPR